MLVYVREARSNKRKKKNSRCSRSTLRVLRLGGPEYGCLGRAG